MKQYNIFTVGWDPDFIDLLIEPIQNRTGFNFTHGLVGDASRTIQANKNYPQIKFIALSKSKEDPLPKPDYSFLASLESVGVPSVRNMIRGDRVLRHLSESEALGYATLIARQIQDALTRSKPDIVLASFDSLHSAMSLAVARSLNIPWVAMTFTTIPENLMGFSKALTPEALVPIVRTIDQKMRECAKTIIKNVRSRNQKIMAYRAPASSSQYFRQYLIHAKNFIRRKQHQKKLGIDVFTYPSTMQRMNDLGQRALNRLLLPTQKMIGKAPSGKYVYFPLHMAPESSVDTWAPFYQDQLAFVHQLSRAIPIDFDFVIKLHFSDPDNYSRKSLDKLIGLPRIRIAHPNAPGSVFIENAALVIGIQGTSCLEAALLGRPVLLFGDSPYQHFPRSEIAKRPDELYEQIRRMLGRPVPSEEEIIEAYASYMARYMPGRINDWNGLITSSDIDRLSDCFRRLIIYLETDNNRLEWYEDPRFKIQE